MPVSKPALIIHAGAGTYPKHLARAKTIQKKLREISENGYRFLKNHSAVETVVEVTRQLEDWPETNAGVGSVLQSDGKARLSAGLMDGFGMRFSGVINIEQIKNPILVAKLLQREKDRILAAEGAQKFAVKKGFKLFNTRTPERLKQWKAAKKTKFGTVGVCALDARGHLAAATSTGGKGMELVGRVSDSPLPAGNYANSFAAVSATGRGEDIIEETLASTLAIRAQDLGNFKKAFQFTFREAKLRKRLLGAIGVDKNGNVFWDKTTDILYYAFCTRSKTSVFAT